MKRYTNALLEIIFLSEEDVIVTSAQTEEETTVSDELQVVETGNGDSVKYDTLFPPQ